MEAGLGPEIRFLHQFLLVVFVLIALHSVYQLFFVRKLLGNKLISQPYRCFKIATVFLTLWGINRLIICLFVITGNLLLVLQYGVGHGLMLLAIIYISRAATKTREIYIGYQDLNDGNRS